MTSDLRAAVRQTPALVGLRLLRLNWIARRGGHQDFADIVGQAPERWAAARRDAERGPRIVVATNSGGHFGIAAIDRLLAIALTLRGAHAVSVLCDSALPACLLCEINLQPDAARFAARGPARLLCGYCAGPAADALRSINLPLETLSAHLSAADYAEARAFADGVPADALCAATWRGLPIGEHAYAGALRYFARGTLEGEPDGEAVMRRFLAGTVVAAAAYGRLYDRIRPDVVVAHHGIYAPQGIVTAAAHMRGIRVVTWNPAYRKHCFIFSHNDTYHRTLMDEPTDRWAATPLPAAERQRTLDYLASRRAGSEDWIRWHKDPECEARAQLSTLGLDPDKPLISAFTNVFWDAQLHYPQNAFVDQAEWLIETIQAFAARSDLQLAIRVHPAEVSGSPPSRQRAIDQIAARAPKLPPNIVVVPPDSALSSYELAELSDTALIYATKMGVELAAIGIPVIVAGEAWVRNKGISEDVVSKAHYRELLARLPAGRRLDEARHERAIAYANHFFFRRMIALPMVQPTPGPRRFTVAATHLSELAEGGDPGLDVICRGILEGTPFEA